MKFFCHIRTFDSTIGVRVVGNPLRLKYKNTHKRWSWSGNHLDFFLLVRIGHQNFYIGYFK